MRHYLPDPRKWGKNDPQPQAVAEQNGYGTRRVGGRDFPLAPLGEAARRDPRVPDVVPNAGPPRSQADASPAVARKHGIGVGDGVAYEGFAPSLIYLKRLGNMVTRALARNYLSGVVESRWRVGGISYPLDFGYGPGYHGDAGTVWPNNPQTYMRNPGIRPIYGVPQTFRYAPNMPSIQPLGPTIGDFGNATYNQAPSNASPSTYFNALNHP